MAPRVRTFIAAELSCEVRACAAQAIAYLSTDDSPDSSVKWVRPDDLHLTIKFLGVVDYTGLSEVCRALSRAVANIEPIELECGGVGAFPRPDRPRTIWLGINDPETRLTELANVVDDAMAEIRFRRESRTFHPHLTLGRLRDGHQVGDLAERIQSGGFAKRGELVIDELVVLSSELTPAGPIYTAIGRAELGAS